MTDTTGQSFARAGGSSLTVLTVMTAFPDIPGFHSRDSEDSEIESPRAGEATKPQPRVEGRARPRLLDLCCGIGGATVGYQRAGFDVTGVDRLAMPDYPGRFVRGDALDYLDEYGSTFDAIHASPPCLPHSSLTAGTNRGLRYVDLLDELLVRLRRSQRLAVVENVVGAPLTLHRDLVLCGEAFGLDVIRHRVFELVNWTTPQPEHVRHRGPVSGMRHGKWINGPYVAVYGDGGGKGSVERWRSAMGIDWTHDRHGIAQAIPPSYAEWIGARLMDQVLRRAA